ncbi:T9SS type A sorting domain-containing protein [Flammeovirga sp. SubArs3]|uniref:T9SS type A sorting domain-containing protein n=1 Tax=Flammeovirga sp. SubArs3 TaxID=2995316 RepID=UPI00248AD224|nr:T9SS type A sorting domain-containing protein [Flammeovirga sp. SubArs3]
MKYLVLVSILFINVPLFAQNIGVDVNINMKHTVGDVSTFEREKFITVHAGIRENDWTQYGSTDPSNIKDDLMNQKDVYFGRNTGEITWNINGVLNEDPQRPGFVDLDQLKEEGEKHRENYINRTDFNSYGERNNSHILATQFHPFWPDGKETSKGWSFSQADTDEEPFGTASGEYCAHFIKEYYEQGSEKRPAYFEVINEPIYEMFGCEDCGETDEGIEQIFKYHNTVAKEVKKVNPDMKVGGFTTAFPNFEYDNFQRWEKRWNKFMDTCGENMDFWSIHLYDWPTFRGERRMRKGSNLEATLDMMDHASFDKFGEVKPTLVSEYGAQVHSMLQDQWSSERDWYYLKSTNSMMLTFMDRADNIAKALPFIVLKATWGTVDGVPYNWRLLRQEDEPNSLTGDWVYTDLILFYDLWKDVKGTRVENLSQNVDIQTNAFVDGNQLHLILSNLNQNAETIELSILGQGDNTIESIQSKHLYGINNGAFLKEEVLSEDTEQVTLQAESTMILTYTFAEDIAIEETAGETKYFSDVYYQPIDGTEQSFKISGLEVDEYGEAVLRIGMGRSHALSKQPTVKVNGTNVVVPTNIRGDLQEQRDSFFGVVEIPVPYELLEVNNSISIQFPESGGHISSVNMRVYNFSQEVTRTFDTTPPTSVNDIKLADEIKLYPNPSNGKEVNILVNNQQLPNTFTLLDINGRVIKNEVVSASQFSISTVDLKSGIYIVRLQFGDQFINKKLIIE